MSIFRFKFLSMEICLRKNLVKKVMTLRSHCMPFLVPAICSMSTYLLVNSATYIISLCNDHTTENEWLESL